MRASDGNLRRWITEAAGGEPVEGVVIGEMGWGDYDTDRVPAYASQPRGEVLTWEQAIPHIDYDFDDGLGAPSCNAIYAWTASRVIFISQYDGSTSPQWVPRHPVDILPDMPRG